MPLRTGGAGDVSPKLADNSFGVVFCTRAVSVSLSAEDPAAKVEAAQAPCQQTATVYTLGNLGVT